MLQITVTSHYFQYNLKEVSFHASQMPDPKSLNTTQESKQRKAPAKRLGVL